MFGRPKARTAEGQREQGGVTRHLAAFLARQGKLAEAHEAIADMDQRIERASPQFRREGRHWRDLAARAAGRG